MNHHSTIITKHQMCWDCFVNTPNGQKVFKKQKEEEYENQIVEYENPLCGKIHEVVRWRLEFEGIISFCSNDCDPYNCDKFKKWYKEKS